MSAFTVQQECIPQAILGMDVLSQAKSGMGKTAVFVLATLQQLEPADGEASVLILCHTRELAFQIKNEYARFTKYMPHARTGVFYGGVSIKQNIDSLKEQIPHVVVGTPGRILALLREKALSLRKIKYFVLDECDKLLEQLGKITAGNIFPILCQFIFSDRHEKGRPGHFCPDASRQASDDVQCHLVQGNQAHLQEVHAKCNDKIVWALELLICSLWKYLSTTKPN